MLKDILFASYRRVYAKFWWKLPWLFFRPKTPHIVEVELTNDCNQACPHCARHFMDREIGYMDVRLFKRLVAEVNSPIQRVF